MTRHIINGTYLCRTCKEWKPTDCFSNDARAKCGIKSQCRKCTNAQQTPRQKERYHSCEITRLKQIGYSLAWNDANHDRFLQIQRDYYYRCKLTERIPA